MTIRQHKTEFAGYPAVPWFEGPLRNPATTAYRITSEDTDESWIELFETFLQQDGAEHTQALIVGACWEEDFDWPLSETAAALIQHADRLPNLRALFIPDMTSEECEISWLHQTNLTPLLNAYPRLEVFGSRGMEGLAYPDLHHAHLRSWIIETGGLSRDQLNEIKRADLPQLIDFEVWTGSQRYGWDGTLNDLLPIIRGETFPHLRRLGICDCEITDDVVLALVESPLYPQLEHLDLSRGLLSDVGAKALLSHPATKRLTSLDVRHHFCTPPVEAQLYGLMGNGVRVLVDEGQRLNEWWDNRYVAVGE